jgi:hypothetical protein
MLYVPDHPPHPPHPTMYFDVLVSVLCVIMLDGRSYPISVTDYNPNVWNCNMISRIFAALNVCEKIHVTLCSLLCNNFVFATAPRLFSDFPQSRPRFNLLLDLVGYMMGKMALKRNCLRKLRCTRLNHNFCILKCHLGSQYQGTQSYTSLKVMKKSMGTKHLVTPVSGSWKGQAISGLSSCFQRLRTRARVRAHTQTHTHARANKNLSCSFRCRWYITRWLLGIEIYTYFGHEEQTRTFRDPLSV